MHVLYIVSIVVLIWIPGATSITCHTCVPDFHYFLQRYGLNWFEFQKLFGFSGKWNPEFPRLSGANCQLPNATFSEECDGPCVTLGFNHLANVSEIPSRYTFFLRGCHRTMTGQKPKLRDPQGGPDRCEMGQFPIVQMQSYVQYCGVDHCNADIAPRSTCRHDLKCRECEEADGRFQTPCDQHNYCTGTGWCSKLHAEGTGSDGKDHAGSQYACRVNPQGVETCIKPERAIFVDVQKRLGDPGIGTDTKSQLCFCNSDLCNSAVPMQFNFFSFILVCLLYGIKLQW